VDDGEALYIPRGYFNEVVKKRFNPAFEFQASSGACEMRPTPAPTPRDGQEKVIQSALALLKEHPFGGAIFEVKTGGGKTFILLETARRLGLKTLVIVHTTVLMKQWMEEIRKFMPNWSVGVIQGSTCDTKNNDICVAMLQSVALGEDYPEWVYDEFGTICFDETHLVASTEFKKALFKFRARYVLGASGTLARKDRAENVFKYGIGKVVEGMEEIQVLSPTIYMVDTNHCWTEGRGELDRQKNYFLKAITEDTARNELIVQNTVKAALSGRHVLVLSERVGHVESLFRMIITRLIDQGISVGMMVGSSSDCERAVAIESQVIIATLQLVGVGFNVPRLDTLIMATPIQSMEQAVGRVLRHSPDKKAPIVVDLVDSGSEIGTIFGLSRMKKYRMKNWKIVCPQNLFNRG
jgi:superfamily II DNA or RNA helicase